MKRTNEYVIIVFFLFISCKENSLLTESEVYQLKVYPCINSNRLNNNLDDLYNSLGRPDVCNQFIKLYPDTLDKSYQTVLLNYARKKIDSLSLDLIIFNKCLDAAGINSIHDTCFYPLYFEETLFNGEEVWNFGSVYEIDFGVIKVKDISSISVNKNTFKVMNVLTYLPLKPEVRKSKNNYDTISVGKEFGATKIAADFRQRYKNIYNMKLRTKIDEVILNSVDSLDEDREEFRKWYQSSIIPFSMWTLPCLVESSKFMNKEVWIVELVYGNPDYGHYQYYIIDKITHEVLLVDGCL